MRIEQFPEMASLAKMNESVKTNSSSVKVDCAKECPCGVPVIPVPDQWLEVMVTGGFKVWHIIFIVIAFVVTLVVVYCCFHRCRIPRTKQEIEADLLKANLTTKFRDYLQELPTSETITFVEALKRVADIEEKLELEDQANMAGARKRMGWLKLKGKGKGGQSPDKPEVDQQPTGEDDPKAELAPSTIIGDTDGMQTDAKPQVIGVGVEEPNAAKKQTETTNATNAEPIDPPAKTPKCLIDNQTDRVSTSHDTSKGSHKHLRVDRKRDKPNLARTKRTRESSHDAVEVDATNEKADMVQITDLATKVSNELLKENRHQTDAQSKDEQPIKSSLHNESITRPKSKEHARFVEPERLTETNLIVNTAPVEVKKTRSKSSRSPSEKRRETCKSDKVTRRPKERGQSPEESNQPRKRRTQPEHKK